MAPTLINGLYREDCIYMCVHVYIYTCIHVDMQTYMHMYIHIHTHTRELLEGKCFKEDE